MLVALVTAVLTLVVRSRSRSQQVISLLGSVGYLVAVAVVFDRVATAGPIAYQLSGWPAPFGITIVADALSTFMLALTAVVSLGATVFSIRYIDTYGQQLAYHPLYHLMVVGISGAFLTGDIFNLFVWFEVMLMASYVLVVFYSGPEHTRAALTYVVLNLVGSAVMLLAIGGIYATTGTLNMADIARRLGDPQAFNVALAPVLGLSGLLFAVFALKAGIVPFQFWVPGAYRAAPAPIAAMLAAVVKKVGIYAIIRLYFTVFAAAELPLSMPGIQGSSFLSFYGPVLFLMAGASILLGGIAAVSREDIDGLLSYSSISQVGFIVMPLAVGATVPAVRPLAITAALVYTLNHAIAKGALFLTSGAIYDAVGSIEFVGLGGLTEETPTLSVAFFVGGLALIGIPPLSGFFGKLLVYDVVSRAGADIALAFVLLGAILTIAYISKAWNRGFWGTPTDAVLEADDEPGLVAVVLVLTMVLLAIGIGFELVLGAAEAATAAALDRGTYIETVLGGTTT
ncbi:MAG: proton-conducting transporter membrane subunit [Halobacteriales archaeon]|nr:proton-conducting transporter membrane subunit [Halobacteriales archaeon]